MPTLVSTDKDTERQLWSAEEFLDWLEPKVYADLIAGKKFMHSPVSFRHATILNFLQVLLVMYVERLRLGRVDRENIALCLSPRDVFMPDLLFFNTAQVARLRHDYADFAPALVVEALSPRTAARDVGPKFTAYEAHGVEEYWVLDPQTLAHRFYRREADGGELFVEFANRGEERIESRAVPGFWLRRAWLDPVNPPTVAACLQELVAER